MVPRCKIGKLKVRTRSSQIFGKITANDHTLCQTVVAKAVVLNHKFVQGPVIGALAITHERRTLYGPKNDLHDRTFL